MHNEILDKYLSAYFYSKELFEKGATPDEHALSDEKLKESEAELFTAYELESEESFDEFYTLVEEYRKDETKYYGLISFLGNRVND